MKPRLPLSLSLIASFLGASLLAGLPAAHAAERLPLLTLQVEWRWVPDLPPGQVARGQGGYSAGTDTGIRSSQGGTVARTTPPRQDDADFGVLRTLNGRPAQFSDQRLTQLQWWAPQVKMSTDGRPPAPGASAPEAWMQAQSRWVPLGQTVKVEASWPGGRKPVRLSLSVESERMQGADRTRQQSLSLEQLLPMDEWQTVAAEPGAHYCWREAGGAAEQALDAPWQAQGGYSAGTTARRQQAARCLQVRISAVP